MIKFQANITLSFNGSVAGEDREALEKEVAEAIKTEIKMISMRVASEQVKAGKLQGLTIEVFQ